MRFRTGHHVVVDRTLDIHTIGPASSGRDQSVPGWYALTEIPNIASSRRWA